MYFDELKLWPRIEHDIQFLHLLFSKFTWIHFLWLNSLYINGLKNHGSFTVQRLSFPEHFYINITHPFHSFSIFKKYQVNIATEINRFETSFLLPKKSEIFNIMFACSLLFSQGFHIMHWVITSGDISKCRVLSSMTYIAYSKSYLPLVSSR